MRLLRVTNQPHQSTLCYPSGPCTGGGYQKTLRTFGVIILLNCVGNCTQTAVAEQFSRGLKARVDQLAAVRPKGQGPAEHAKLHGDINISRRRQMTLGFVPADQFGAADAPGDSGVRRCPAGVRNCRAGAEKIMGKVNVLNRKSPVRRIFFVRAGRFLTTLWQRD